jgi:hypothetical protein
MLRGSNNVEYQAGFDISPAIGLIRVSELSLS